MQIYTKNNSCIIATEDRTFIIDNEKFKITNASEVESLVNICVARLKMFFQEEFLFDAKPQRFSHADTIVLLALGRYFRGLYCVSENRSYDIVFSYNFPLIYEKHLFPYIIKLFDKVVNAQLIALGISSEFVVVDTSNPKEFAVFYKNFGHLLRYNDQKVIINNDKSLLDTLMVWRNYCFEKFEQLYSMDAIEVYSEIYAINGFEPLTYSLNGQIMAQGVRYKSDISKTVYYCIFAWDRKFKSKSPGIYAYAKTITLCHEIGYKFSFCYGPQDYKFRLINSFTRE
jgi:hypothetical protein